MTGDGCASRWAFFLITNDGLNRVVLFLLGATPAFFLSRKRPAKKRKQVMEKHLTIVGLGEILWDVFPDGPRFGGAPANFSCHAAALGGRTFMVGAVGADELGDSAIKALQGQRVATERVTRFSDYPTGTVQVKLDGDGQARYEFGKDEAWDHLDWSDEMADLAGRTGAVCFGTLAQRGESSRRTIQRFVSQTPERSLRIFDVNLRPPLFRRRRDRAVA